MRSRNTLITGVMTKMTSTNLNFTKPAKLSPSKIAGFKRDPDGPRTQRLWDTSAVGLGVEVFKNNRQKFIYRYRFDGAQKFIAIGYTTDVDLVEARAKAGDFAVSLSKGIDPKEPVSESVQKLKSDPMMLALLKANGIDLDKLTLGNAETAPNQMTLQELFDEFVEEDFDGYAAGTQAGLIGTYNTHLKQEFGHRRIDQITRSDIRGKWRALIKAGHEGAARGFLSRTKMIFNHAIANDYLTESPTDRIKAKKGTYATTGKRDIYLDTDEQLLAAWNNDCKPQVRSLVRWILATGCRREEALNMRHDQIQDGVWRVESTKNDRPLVLPVTPLMASIVKDMAEHYPSDWVFHNPENAKRRIPDGSVASLLTNRLGFSPHVLRHTVVSQLANLKVGQESRDLVTNHTNQSVDRLYNHGEQIEMKRDALMTWHKKLRSVVHSHIRMVDAG